ncbi:UDP-N-acetylmuramate dehydrogenase [Capnocytophaga canis]|uniref:UDP-N-acetylmuramate dehydrogenase n=1 Tax=Capnocytophaga canis TaxID=1848903 RepID=UPI003858E5EE
MIIEHYVSLKPFNTFGIDAQATTFVTIHSEKGLIKALSNYKNPFIFGGGSNMLLTKNIENPVFWIQLKGISIERETDDHVWITAAAGENWHEFVQFCLEKGYGGLENLSLIPGNVGATPIQNIGAYGVEIKDVMAYCQTINIHSITQKQFSKDECKFSYRESIFKCEEKGNYIITSVTFKLTKKNHILHTEYGAIREILEQKNIKNPQPIDISKAVISIRESKLPNPKEIGNSGSFFKNPIVSKIHFEKLQKIYPQMPHYVVNEESTKIPAGWLIETCGLKGYRRGDVGVHQKQALVLVNYGNATGQELVELSKFIQQTVYNKFQIHLESEVNIIQ